MRYRLIIMLAVVALIAGALGISGASASSPPAFDVTVVNPLTKPVPVTVTNPMSVTGPVQVTNAEGTSLKVEAAPVKIDPAQNAVKVDSSAASPVSTSETKEPVNLRCYAPAVAGAVDKGGSFYPTLDYSSNPYEVPEGKCLVITGIDVVGNTHPGEAAKYVFVSVRYGAASPDPGYYTFMEMEYLGTEPQFGEGIYQAHRDCELYAREGAHIGAYIRFDKSVTSALGIDTSADVTGYLVDAP